jgi:glycosyltransferase involved in cell wall biosynthesis
MGSSEALPKISVVCPTYNSASFVLPTLEHVVNQVYLPYEIIVCDDGSADETVSVVRNFLKDHPGIRSQLIVNPHRGPGATRNTAVRHASGDWIAFIDSDDVWLPHKLEVVAQSIRDHSEANFFCHSEEQIRQDGSRQLLDYGKWYDRLKPLPFQLYHRNFFSTSAVTCRRSLLLDSGLFDEFLMSSQDYELWLRMSPQISPYFINDVLGFYYDREGNITSGKIWSRWMNMVRIAYRHRKKTTVVGSLYHLLRFTAAFGVQGLHKRFAN